MCRNIRVLFNFEPPATEQEIQAAALQYVRKVSGTQKPSLANQRAFDRAIRRVARATHELIEQLETNASPRSRDVELERARERNRKRFGADTTPARTAPRQR
jgi:hypothetical protein